MHKLALDVANLHVESFAALDPGATTGRAGEPRPSDRLTCDSCAGPACRPARESCASGGVVCCG